MSVCKQFLNDPKCIVEESLQGLLATHPNLSRVPQTNSIVVRDVRVGFVAVISGGGSGHEPAHAGFVGAGCLDGAVCGGVFASPSTSAVLKTLHYFRERGASGALLLIKNYNGDQLNFSAAAKMIAASTEGKFPVEVVAVADDVAFVERYIDDPVALAEARKDARGIAGTVLIYKVICQENSDSTATPKQLADQVRNLNSRTFTYGMALESCTLPGNAKPNVSMGPASVSFGLGIHGEDGVEHCDYLLLDAIVAKLCEHVFRCAGLLRGESVDKQQKHFVLAVNNLGGVNDLEFGAVLSAVLRYTAITTNGCVSRLVYGRFMTSLDMKGISITVLCRGSGTTEQEWNKLLAALDAPPPVGVSFASVLSVLPPPPTQIDEAAKLIYSLDFDKSAASARPWLYKLLLYFATNDAIIQKLDDADAAVGDGDTGRSTSRGASAAVEVLRNLPAEATIDIVLAAIGEAIADKHAGSSGPVIGAMLCTTGSKLNNGSKAHLCCDVAAALAAGVTAVMELGGASVGDRTMVDVLAPVAEAAVATGSNEDSPTAKWVQQLLVVAKEKAHSVQQLQAKRGRSRYLGASVLGKPDPGCELVVAVLEKLAEVLSIE